MKIECAYYTNRGISRGENQDALYIGGFAVTGDMETPCAMNLYDAESACFAVIDGAGGHSSGEVASRTVAAEFVKRAAELLRNVGNLTDEFTAIQYVMTEMSGCDRALHGMAATLAGVLITGDKVTAFNIGDSRVYSFKQENFQKLTRDHSTVQVLFEHGMITEDEMRLHPNKGEVTSALVAGEESPPKVFETTVTVEEGQFLLICSDGVWESLSNDEIRTILLESENNVETAASKLRKELLSTECRDNISFMILAFRRTNFRPGG